MTHLPEKTYLRLSDVAMALGGRRQVAKHQQAGDLRRVKLTGYKQWHYLRAEVIAIQRKMSAVT